MPFDKKEFNRTIFIVREISEGKILELPDGYMLGMGGDMSIGYRISREDGSTTLSTLSLCELNSLLNHHDIWDILP